MSYFPRRAGEPAVEPVTLAEALEHVLEAAGVADAKIMSLIKAARIACENRIERSLISTPWVVAMDGFPSAVVLRQPPIIAVQSVTYLDEDEVLQTLDPQDYLLDKASEPGYLVPATGRAWPATFDRINAVQVNYTAGYGSLPTDVPEPLRQWILLAVGDMYDKRRLHTDRPEVRMGFADYLLDPYRILGL